MNIEYKNNKIELINYLKGFSILAIFLMHNIQWFLCPINSFIDNAIHLFGGGVHVFFLVSAIGMTLSYIRKPVKYINYIKGRFINIYLPYIFIIIIESLLPFIKQENRVMALLSHVFLFKMFSNKLIESFGIPFWFMSGIISFYIIFILLRNIQIKLSDGKFVVISFFISFAWMIFVCLIGKTEERAFNSFFLKFLWEFSIGMVIAEYFYKYGSITIGYMQLFVAMILGIGIHGALGIIGFKGFNFFSLIGFCSLALLMSNISCVNTISKLVGQFSYELYLVHYLASRIVGLFIKNNIIAFMTSLIFAITLAIIYNRIINKFRTM